MTETAIRDLLHQAMAADEPPIGSGLLGEAVHAARRIRRRRIAGAGAAVVLLPAVAFGVLALTGVAPGQAHRISPSAATSGKTAKPSVTITPSGGYPFIPPWLPASHPVADPVPITAQSFGQLLMDELPAGARHSQIRSTVDEGGKKTSRFRLSEASLNRVSTASGIGSVGIQLTNTTDPGPAMECVDPGVSCMTYHLSGGVQVNENVTQSAKSANTMIIVTAYRPRVGLVSITEYNSPAGAGSVNTRLPLSFRQLVAAALDPRWGYTISRSFAEHASHLHVLPELVVPGG